MNINWFFISSLSLAITTLFLIIILIKYGKEKIHKMWMLVNIAIFLWGTGATIISTITDNYRLAALIWRLTDIAVTFIPVLLLHMIFLLTKRVSRIILIFAYLQAILCIILIFKTNLIWSTNFIKYSNYSFLLIPSPGRLYYLWFIFWVLISGYVHFQLIVFCLNQPKEEKKYLKLLASAIIIGSFCGSFNFLYTLDLPFYPFANFGIVIYCLILTYAIFKHQLLGIEIIYRKSLLYSLLIATISIIYLLLIMFIEWLLRGIVGYKSFIISLSSAFIIAVIFIPLRNKIQSLTDRFFFGKTPQEITQENELLRQELERSDRLKAASTLALGLAHEIKNPLTTIKTFSEFLPNRQEDKEFLNKFAKLIPEEVERINSIVHQLLDFSKPAPPVFKEISFYTLIHGIVELLSNDFLKRKIKINESFDDTNIKIKADPVQLKQALLNIILNAMEAMPNGGNISIKTTIRQDNYLEIEIIDEGCGIAEKDLKHIFDPFFSTKESGTGLGLSIAHQIIKNHKGTITIESELGKGTTFRIRLPMGL